MKEPLVMCLTNTVAANFTANVLLAIGAKPAMVEEAHEAAELAPLADATLVNVGTLTPEQGVVMQAAVRALYGKPWVLDPVAVHVLSYRRRFIREMLVERPSVVRGNHEEIDFLFKTFPDLMASIPAVLSTGAEDRIYRNGEAGETVNGGVELLTRVTATGCAQGAICAAFLGWGRDPKEACLAASLLLKTAGEKAAKHAKRPGSFQIALLDALAETI